MRRNFNELIDMGKRVGIDLDLNADDLRRYEIIAYFNIYHKDINLEKLREYDNHNTLEKVLEKLEEERLNKVITYLRND